MKTKKSKLKDVALCVVVSTLIIAVVFAMFYAGMSRDFFIKWIGFVIMTALVFGVFIQGSRPLSRKRPFWRMFTSLLIAHCAAWAIILAHAKTWKFIWFYPMILEILILEYGRSQLKRKLHRGITSQSSLDSD